MPRGDRIIDRAGAHLTVADVREVALRAIALAVQGHVLAMAEDARE